MKICIISDDYPPLLGGISTHVYWLSKYLSEDDRIEKVSVITFNSEIQGEEMINEKLDVLRLQRKKRISTLLSTLKELFLRRDYDVFHATTLYPSIPIAFFKIFMNKKSFVTIYGLDALSKTKSRPLFKYALNKADKVIAFSESTKREVARAYNLDEERFKTIYTGIFAPELDKQEVEELRNKYNIRQDDFVILFVGRLDERKGVDDLMYAVSGMKEEKVKFLIVGDGQEREKLMKLRKNLNLERKVIFVGSISYDNVFVFYGLADVFCMPSKYIKEKGNIEGLGIVFLEAQSYGVPCIGTNSGGIREAIEDGKSGFIVPESNPEAIKEKILKLMNDKELYERMSKYAPEFVRKKFSWRRCVDEHIKLYIGIEDEKG